MVVVFTVSQESDNKYTTSSIFIFFKTVVIILNLSATIFRDAPGFSNSLRISILVDNGIEVIPGIIEEGNGNEYIFKNPITYITAPLTVRHNKM